MVDQKLSETVDTDTILFNIDGMTCASYAMRIERVLDRQEGVEAASVNLAGATVLVRVGPNTDPAALAAAVEKIGYQLEERHEEAGDVVLLNGDPRLVPTAIDLANDTFRTIKQNLFWAFGYNTAAIPLAALGFLNPMIAAGAMAFSSVSVVLNALRLKRFKTFWT